MRLVGKIVIFTVCILSLMVLATNTYALPAAPTTPPTFDLGGSSGGSGSSGGGDSSGGGSYTPPAFKPYSVNLISSDSTTTGNIAVKDYYLSTVTSNTSLGSGNDTWGVGFIADMSSLPSDAKLNIRQINTNNLSMPLDTDIFSPIAAFSLTRSASGGEWQMKDGTVFLSLSMPVSLLNGVDLNQEFYLLKDDGTRFIIYRVTPLAQNGMAIFNIPLWYESKSPSTSGTFMLAGQKAGVSIATTPTPVLSATPIPVTPTPKSGSGIVVLSLIAALGISAVFLSRGKKL